MDESFDESGPIQALESLSEDSCEELDVSMGNLSLCDAEYDSDQPRSSTPNTEQIPVQGKHKLTPLSTKAAESPKPKRFCAGSKSHGREVSQRKAASALLLNGGFELKEGSQTPYEAVVAYLGLDTCTNKSFVTRLVKQTFTGVYMKRVRKANEKQVYFINLRLKCSARRFSEDRQETYEVNDDINNLLSNLEVSDLALNEMWETILSSNNDGGDISGKLAEYAKESQNREQLIGSLINIYKGEIVKLSHDIPKTALSDDQKYTVKLEMKVLEDICDTNIRGSSVHDASNTIVATLLKDILEAVNERCPLIYDMVKTLVISNPVSRNLLKTNTHKLLCGLHTLGIISNIRNSKTRNCFPLIFGLLCISFGAGTQFVDMLQSMGLSLSWKSIMSFMDKRLTEFQSLIDKHAPISKPVILLLDNINMYHGNRSHHRLFKLLGPKMWNFTVRGLFIPDLMTIENLFKQKETAEQAQSSGKITAWDTFIETNPHHLKLWNEVQDNFLLTLLNTSLNCLPSSEKEIVDMDEKEFDQWLQGQDFSKSNGDYDIVLPKQTITTNSNCQKSETLILPLSLENNATTTGTAAIIEEFGKEFGVSCQHAKEYLPFDDKGKTFDLAAARTHHRFIASLQTHKSSMVKTVQQLHEAEKAFDLPTTQPTSNDNDEATSQQKVDGRFKSVLDNLNKRMWEAQHDSDLSKLDQFIGWLDGNRNYWENIRDCDERTIIHAAVENGNTALVKTLISAGVDVNAKEMCGATPLTIAIVTKNEELSQLLVQNLAIFDSRYFTTIPNPVTIAEKMEMDIVSTMENMSNQDLADNIEIWRTFHCAEQPSHVEICTSENSDTMDEDEVYEYKRSNKSCLTLTVGDQGTNKVIRGVKGRSEAAYGWCAEVPGDMHAKGYVYEVCKKVMSPGGFMYILQNVLARKKITNESFGKKKFQEQNLNRIEEAVRDVAAAFGIASVLHFKNSNLFPNSHELLASKRSTGNHNAVLLGKLKQWLTESCEDVTFKYYSQMFTLFGPLQQMYCSAIRYGNGIAREASWMIMHPLFAQSNKRNYHTEAMVHIVNFIYMWPLATRELLRKNCSISLNGNEGRNLALDEWVESCVVQPMKKYSTGHTTVQMLQRLMANIDLLIETRKSFQARDAFNVHPTTKHTEQDPFPDQVKAAHFILRNQFLKYVPGRKNVKKYGDPKNGSVSLNNIDAYEAGKKKVVATFNRKLFNIFGIINKDQTVAVSDEDSYEGDSD